MSRLISASRDTTSDPSVAMESALSDKELSSSKIVSFNRSSSLSLNRSACCWVAVRSCAPESRNSRSAARAFKFEIASSRDDKFAARDAIVLSRDAT